MLVGINCVMSNFAESQAAAIARSETVLGECERLRREVDQATERERQSQRLLSELRTRIDVLTTAASMADREREHFASELSSAHAQLESLRERLVQTDRIAHSLVNELNAERNAHLKADELADDREKLLARLKLYESKYTGSFCLFPLRP